MDATAHADIAFSRSAGLLSQLGNADSILKTSVSDEAADDWRRMARSFGMASSEFLQICVYERLYGVDGVAMMTRKQIAKVAGKGTDSGTGEFSYVTSRPQSEPAA